jgi:polyisoprenoid-binding protein YceI
MASLRSDREGLTKHLESAEFFDVDKYPTSHFSATTFRPDPADGRTHELSGKLSLHGVERQITFPAEIHVEKKRATGHAELTIDPRDYGIEHPALREELVDTNVMLEIQLTFPRGGN